MKFVLAHPGTGPFVQQTARALLEAGLLATYWTTLADRPDALWRHVLIHLGRVSGLNLDLELRRREITEIPLERIRLKPFWEVVRLLSSKLGADIRFVQAVWEYGLLNFDRHIARQALNNVDGVYGYQFCALATFQEAQRRGLARVYDVPGPDPIFVERLLQDEIAQFPELNDGKRDYFLAREIRLAERVRQEWALSDVVVTNSKFTSDSYLAAGLEMRKVRIVRLGAPALDSRGAVGKGEIRGPLHVLWAGNFDILKGAHYLLSAWRLLASNKAAVLDIYGANDLPRKLTSNLPSTINLSPTVPRTLLFDRYRAADVLVFPTLCDGFGMVVTEAFAHGLPVITTLRAGAAELVQHKINGLIVPAGDASALAEALEWCLTHRVELHAMRHAALETAARWQWHDFRQALATNVIDGLREAGYTA
jgi:glycosyltransferase involved in cell wall biosynthesis